eukprot:TRINITY_DN28899_c0_g2_i1.p1 TRINITY_DN28899_c0_g2~~TRINITY_DN28899_c0_g2_i1.p1  ORF type:complete len:833 (-),score=140.48 TRINITY_DN28899_c0_g2_i1:109-2607(-)
MFPRSVCTSGHPLERKIVTGGVIGIRWKACHRCRTELVKDVVRHSCKACRFHLCETCFQQPACPRGHPLEDKVVKGGMLGLELRLKHCTQCRAELGKDSVRHSCKACNFHLCGACCGSLCGGRRAETVGPRRKTVGLGGIPCSSRFHLPLATVGAGDELRGIFAATFGSTPSDATASGAPAAPVCLPCRPACRYGSACYQTKMSHLTEYAHPGDRNYRIGLVSFNENTKPEFESLLQLFQYHDPDESGHLSLEEFSEALSLLDTLAPRRLPETVEEAWKDANGPVNGHLNFRQFTSWTQKFLQLELPLGLEAASAASRPCRFMHLTVDGERCSCPGFRPSAVECICECGHKRSAHRSDGALASFTQFFESNRNPQWEPGRNGLVQITDQALLAKLQNLLATTHKTTDNWTRDRGCLIHGVNGPGCSARCAKDRVPVPSGYSLLTAFRNQNVELWMKYCLLRSAIQEELDREGAEPVEALPVQTSSCDLGTSLITAENEWYLFHGCSVEKCANICSSNFRVSLSGSGATWKEPGKAKGTPLYGFGLYFAEHVTKADEYTEPVPDEDITPPEGAGEEDFYTVLVCRVFGGRTNVVMTNEIDREKLKADVFDGPYHSVFGDRVAKLGKPYREVVVYDKDQCYPEFLLVYSREYGGDAPRPWWKSTAGSSPATEGSVLCATPSLASESGALRTKSVPEPASPVVAAYRSDAAGGGSGVSRTGGYPTPVDFSMPPAAAAAGSGAGATDADGVSDTSDDSASSPAPGDGTAPTAAAAPTSLRLMRHTDTGRIGEVLHHDPKDPDLTYKLRYSDGGAPEVDWVGHRHVSEVEAKDAAHH